MLAIAQVREHLKLRGSANLIHGEATVNIPPQSRPDRAVLSEQLAARVLARASELDSASHAQATVSDLRAAAMEAGISAHAFDTALAEVQEQERVSVRKFRQPRSTRRRWVSVIGLALVMATGTLVVSRLLPASTVIYYPPPSVEEAPR